MAETAQPCPSSCSAPQLQTHNSLLMPSTAKLQQELRLHTWACSWMVAKSPLSSQKRFPLQSVWKALGVFYKEGV